MKQNNTKTNNKLSWINEIKIVWSINPSIDHSMNPLMNESISLLKQNDLKVVYTVLHIKHRIKERKMYKK